ncbi:MAG: carbohydrate-binding domain-containing protein, partial [Muribaculaceae bacterium]|nr:carbohydrate-binding domain-containing protein [Muribaculaceae bacterium]
DAKGINVAEPFLFTGGELNVVLTGKQSSVAPKGVKCDTDCTIQGGSFYSCTPNGRALDVDGTLTIQDGYTTLNLENGCTIDNLEDSRLVEISY